MTRLLGRTTPKRPSPSTLTPTSSYVPPSKRCGHVFCGCFHQFHSDLALTTPGHPLRLYPPVQACGGHAAPCRKVTLSPAVLFSPSNPPPPSPYPLYRRMEESGHSVSPDQSMFLFLKLISRSALPPNVHISLNLFSLCHSAPSPLLSTTSPTPCKPRPFLNPGRCLPRPSRQQTKQQVPKGAMQMLPVLPLFKTLARSPLPAPSHTCPLTPRRG